MSCFFIVSYDIESPAQYADYNPGSNHVTLASVAQYGGEILVATQLALHLSGAAKDMTVIIQFPNREAAVAWHEGPEYAQAKSLRLQSTHNITALVVDGLSERVS
ncbi:DUF1330 domain-containing protein [Shewanella gelidii]|uniref:DUF1330 domain-containing protein n=1 Tax=Shewanella gelidii TaxID=1642821 RepID=A0A917N8P7_9GAMM|nr:DUF1330 domain-containing protein [Shewanella gelidii]MCL1096950.1 DUF1330 domain-containing protein [Shewanella gelidii]GGI71460.1 hypothetical protein GCM10009332_05960 [Shewanella gelidii]